MYATFNTFDYDMKSATDDYFYCRDCGSIIFRHKGYVKSYIRQNDPNYLAWVTETYMGGMSSEALELLLFLIKNINIPSFCYVFEDKPKVDSYMAELESLNLIRNYVFNNTYTCVLLNSYEVCLFDDIEILKHIPHQKDFYFPKLNPIDRKSTLIRKARLAALINDFTDEEESLLRSKFGNKCALTGKSVPLHMDHVIPIVIGHGGTTLSNMLPIWQRINSSKGAKNIFVWYEENGERFGVCPDRFTEVIEYIAELNEMTTEEYREYVYECHANPNEIN